VIPPDPDVPLGAVVALSEFEQQLCRLVSDARCAANVGNGVADQLVGGAPGVGDGSASLNGIGAEWAFCRLFNVYPDTTIHPRSSRRGTDAGGDCRLRCGLSVDVKVTEWPRGGLLVVRWKGRGADLYALLTGRFPRYVFRGFAPADLALAPGRVSEAHRGGFMTPQADLMRLSRVMLEAS